VDAEIWSEHHALSEPESRERTLGGEAVVVALLQRIHGQTMAAAFIPRARLTCAVVRIRHIDGHPSRASRLADDGRATLGEPIAVLIARLQTKLAKLVDGDGHRGHAQQI
jgi:hypothetical protein